MAIGNDKVITCRPADLIEPELEMHFYKVLRELGVHVKVESNER